MDPSRNTPATNRAIADMFDGLAESLRPVRGTCEWHHWMDHRFGTEPNSPLHHDNRCPDHGAPHHRRH